MIRELGETLHNSSHKYIGFRDNVEKGRGRILLFLRTGKLSSKK